MGLLMSSAAALELACSEDTINLQKDQRLKKLICYLLTILFTSKLISMKLTLETLQRAYLSLLMAFSSMLRLDITGDLPPTLAGMEAMEIMGFIHMPGIFLTRALHSLC